MSRAEALRLADSLQDLLVLGGVHTDPVGQQSVEMLRRWPDPGEPVAWVDDLSRPQPHCVTDLKYCSVAQHERGDHLNYVPLYTAPPAERIAALEEDSAIQREAFHMMRDRADYLEAALAERDKVIEQARVALEYHMAQTRPIQLTIDVLRVIQEVQR